MISYRAADDCPAAALAASKHWRLPQKQWTLRVNAMGNYLLIGRFTENAISSLNSNSFVVKVLFRRENRPMTAF
jgi:hypothetical protein